MKPIIDGTSDEHDDLRSLRGEMIKPIPFQSRDQSNAGDDGVAAAGGGDTLASPMKKWSSDQFKITSSTGNTCKKKRVNSFLSAKNNYISE